VRTVTRAPVFGPLRSAIAAALARADRFGIIAFADPSIARQRRTLAAMGAAGRIAGHIPLNLPMEVLTDPVAPRAALVEAACGVPVIEPCQAAAAPASQAVIAARAARIEAAA
jgi:Asp/Glu/hydantoin racemase